MSTSAVDVVRAYFAAWPAKDRTAVEALVTDESTRQPSQSHDVLRAVLAEQQHDRGARDHASRTRRRPRVRHL